MAIQSWVQSSSPLALATYAACRFVLAHPQRGLGRHSPVTDATNYTWDSSHQIKWGGFVQLSEQRIGRVNERDNAETSETDESVVARDAGGAGGWRVDSTAAQRIPQLESFC
ncbi:hypothetical protein TSMEX_008904 [Taenia solium]|eukprot:TsM_000559400 transcript=TsM_000559400 gene=TsM_000559400